MAGEGTSGVIKVPWGRFFEVSRDRMREASPEPSPPCNPLGDKRKSRPLKERGSPISEQSFTRKRLKDAGNAAIEMALWLKEAQAEAMKSKGRKRSRQ
eukprot:64852-Hanusia_phi.AAC.5